MSCRRTPCAEVPVPMLAPGDPSSLKESHVTLICQVYECSRKVSGITAMNVLYGVGGVRVECILVVPAGIHSLYDTSMLASMIYP
jgi:hypothetical protein